MEAINNAAHRSHSRIGGAGKLSSYTHSLSEACEMYSSINSLITFLSSEKAIISCVWPFQVNFWNIWYIFSKQPLNSRYYFYAYIDFPVNLDDCYWCFILCRLIFLTLSCSLRSQKWQSLDLKLGIFEQESQGNGILRGKSGFNYQEDHEKRSSATLQITSKSIPALSGLFLYQPYGTQACLTCINKMAQVLNML